MAGLPDLPPDMQEYWRQQSQRFLRADDGGLGAVVYSGMPLWFNAFHARHQRSTVQALTSGIRLRDARALDVGCGVGRWARVLAASGARVTGIDFELERLRTAARATTGRRVDYCRMSALRLGLADDAVDLTTSVTVLQHLPPVDRERAVAELCRVTRGTGHIMIVELIDTSDSAPHVFPMPIEDWVAAFAAHGFRPVRVRGDEFAPLLRLLRRLQHAVTRRSTLQRGPEGVRLSGPTRFALRMAITASYPLEALCSRLLPARAARHAGLLLAGPDAIRG